MREDAGAQQGGGGVVSTPRCVVTGNPCGRDVCPARDNKTCPSESGECSNALGSSTPRYGDLLRGLYASESNPHRDGIFVRVKWIRTGKFSRSRCFEVTDGNGDFWLMTPSSTVSLDVESGKGVGL